MRLIATVFMSHGLASQWEGGLEKIHEFNRGFRGAVLGEGGGNCYRMAGCGCPGHGHLGSYRDRGGSHVQDLYVMASTAPKVVSLAAFLRSLLSLWWHLKPEKLLSFVEPHAWGRPGVGWIPLVFVCHRDVVSVFTTTSRLQCMFLTCAEQNGEPVRNTQHCGRSLWQFCLYLSSWC
eukprot:m.156676 g.156676  ORF g.156676 m.156676 type:complete len:177 (-) comp14441_c0_seq3:2535-3065(-)